ncbi:MAG TPA: hypothetical protein VM754_10695 [Actinomycetota bacterium]|nr:hypothetical protein [Actinomycetota bacterium]
MDTVGKTLKAMVLGLAVLVSVTLGAVFPVPAFLVLSRHRRTDRTELTLPASPGIALDLEQARVPAELLHRDLRVTG